MHSFIPSLLLAALAGQASALPSFHGLVNHKFDGKGFSAESGSSGTVTHSHHSHTGTGTGTGGYHTGTVDHPSATATLAARQDPETDISFTGSFPTSFPHPTGIRFPIGTSGSFPFPSGTGGSGGFGTHGFVHPSGHAHHASGLRGSHTGGFAQPTGEAKSPLEARDKKSKTVSDESFPSLTLVAGDGIDEATGTGGQASPTGGFRKGSKSGKGEGKHSKTDSKTKTKNSERQEPTGVASSGGFPSGSVPTGNGSGGGYAHPSGGFGGHHSGGFPTGSGFARPTGGFGSKNSQGQAHASSQGGFGVHPSGGFPAGGYPAPTGGFHFPTGTGAPFANTFQTSVVAPSSTAWGYISPGSWVVRLESDCCRD